MSVFKTEAERQFDAFLEKEAVEDVQGAMFKLMRQAFWAGYEAACADNQRQPSHTLIFSDDEFSNHSF